MVDTETRGAGFGLRVTIYDEHLRSDYLQLGLSLAKPPRFSLIFLSKIETHFLDSLENMKKVESSQAMRAELMDSFKSGIPAEQWLGPRVYDRYKVERCLSFLLVRYR